ncbi:hypothetical protein NUW58_g3844 [Xylaria curta]|uniref:Uncharacterized protein n=1 Tax=Xylaria curta TaxID=42375 RepID=A0ACC1P918_9PEZI|nr:hypothetical protein NUW58_g3844 [Xylaria curta]
MTLTPGRAPPNPRATSSSGPVSGSWCAQPYVAGPRYINGPVAVVGPNDRIRIKYELQADGVHWIQSATNLATGKVITQLQSDSGDHQKGVGTAIECNQNCQPTVSDHTYVDWEVRLSKADPAFRNTFGVNQGATYEGVTSEQNGQVWKISKIFIPKMA